MVHGARPVVPPPVGVRLAAELSREGSAATPSSRWPKMRLQLDTLVSDTKKNVQKVAPAPRNRAKPKWGDAMQVRAQWMAPR